MAPSPQPRNKARKAAYGLAVAALATLAVVALTTPAARSVALPAPVPAPAVDAQPLAPSTPWGHRIDRLIGRRAMSVAVGFEDTWLYRHDAGVRRIPASNEKLLLSLALLNQA